MTFKVGAQILTYGSTWDEALDVVGRWTTSATPTSGDTTTSTPPVATRTRASSRAGPRCPHGPRQPPARGWGCWSAPIRSGTRGSSPRWRSRSITSAMAARSSGSAQEHGVRDAGPPQFQPGRTMGERMDWFEESMAIVIGLLAGDEVTHRSEKYQFDRVRHAPQPVQARIPVVIGADGEKRGLKLAARYADIWQWFAPFDGVATFRHKDEVPEPTPRPRAATPRPSSGCSARSSSSAPTPMRRSVSPRKPRRSTNGGHRSGTRCGRPLRTRR